MLKQSNDRKGQITTFVILGLIIVAVVSFLVLMKYSFITNPIKQKTIEEIEFSQAVEKVRFYIQSTINGLAEEGVIILGRQGGLINLEDGYIMTDYSNISSYLPEKEVLSRELSNYISQNLKNALVFENNTFYKIETVDRVTVKTSFTEEKIIIETIFPITIQVGNNTKRLAPFKTELSVRMDKIYNLAKSVIEEPETISYAENLEDMKLNVYKEGDVKIYVLTDRKSEIRGKDYRFLFAENIG